ncbi:prepilin-type N-terminal cleavage/methylation domain-containing protein [Nostoc sp. LEGE 06077]|uniref:hormogonium polysaccharide secretion pseudopilin HpsC n=1 Tax=Nostoc sp. LEGE 06077 TaxID=915325 RepID=UPI00187E71B2|nr:hormogonium polysaccharide secretion pseudopilin HpsC [Nostoc sp. LEGE 06077]MBE9208497.1 prepilin-type N-terminal cleavage/methylation domain-containing protein [Nostoc sp. LEGE 06077]
MKNFLRFLLKIQLQKSQYLQSPKGFTLVELLVALILAFLVITPLMGFMIDVMNTDRQEQAKSTSEQEIQAALAYIAQDMEQAVYIYDADGIYGQTSNSITGILGQLPNGTDTNPNKVPVLVFWKRYFLNKDQTVQISSTSTGRAGCLYNLPSTGGGGCNDQDYMLYSLVAYYIVKDNSATWNSTTTRIERWEIRDGIRDITGSFSRSETINSTTKTVKYRLLPSTGFMPFDLSLEGDLKKKLGNWRKHSVSYDLNTNKFTTLVDYIDQSTSGTPTLAACNTSAGEQQVPDYTKTNVPTTFRTGSFYACVNASKYIARVYMRGNALARIKTGAQYNSQQSAYFPTANIQIKGRGFLGIE